jgi:hypothetical protein
MWEKKPPGGDSIFAALLSVCGAVMTGLLIPDGIPDDNKH